MAFVFDAVPQITSDNAVICCTDRLRAPLQKHHYGSFGRNWNQKSELILSRRA